ncbi:MAG: SAM-dependent methyltransferase [Gammaproteobacteria bacterium]|nr:SAM-dependent methyltransferase [Gammaproteobacteria bacterium]
MSSTMIRLKDLWSKSAQYRAECQTPDDVRSTLELLQLESASSLADVGCGNGAFSIAAARAHSHLKIFAYDALESAIGECDTAARGLPPDQFATGVAMAEHLPIQAAAVDRVLCRAVLHHVAQPAMLYAELARILKPGGQLLLQAPCNFWQPPWSQFMSDYYRLMDDSHVRQYHTVSQVVAGLNDVGLLTYRADCWTYSANNVNDAQRALVHQHNASERLRLRRSDAGEWAVDFYWLRVLAQRL